MTGAIEIIGRQLSEEERIVLAGFALFDDEMRESIISQALRKIERAKAKAESAKIINFSERRFK